MANRDVEIVVGAKDQASRILNRVGESTKDLGRTSKKASRVVEKSGDRMEMAFKGLQASFAPLLAVVAAVKTATAAFRLVGDSAAAFDTQQEAVRGLTRALELNGETSQATIEKHKAFASELQNLTNVGDEVTLGLMKQASMLGVNNEDLQEVTRAAIGLAEATGQGLDEALKKTVQSVNGNAGALQEFIPALRAATTEGEKLAIITQTAEKGLAQKADRAQTAAGSAERLSNTWGDFTEVIGEALAPVRVLINEGLTTLVQVIQSAVIPALQSFTPAGDSIKTVMESVRDVIIKAVTIYETYITNLGKVWGLVANTIKLKVVEIAEDVKHQFTVVIPGYASWFGENFTNLMADAFNSTITVVSNAATNIEDIIKILWDNVKSGFAGGFESVMADIADVASRDLLEGFEAQTQALPDIAARRMTETEAELRNRIGTAATDLATEYRDKVALRMAMIGQEAGSELAEGLQLAVNDAGDQMKEQTGELTNTLANIKSNNQQSLATENVAAVESRLLTRGSTQNRPEQMVKLLERVDKKLGKLIDNTRPDESLSDDTFKVELVT